MSKPKRARRAGGGGGDNPPYEVGYGHPPIEHRFRKGQSGNPNGRPQGRRKSALDPLVELQELALTEALKRLKVREGDTVVEITAVEALVRRLLLAGLRGDRRAMLDFLKIAYPPPTGSRAVGDPDRMPGQVGVVVVIPDNGRDGLLRPAVSEDGDAQRPGGTLPRQRR